MWKFVGCLCAVAVVAASCGSSESAGADEFCDQYETIDIQIQSDIDLADPDGLKSYFTEIQQSFETLVEVAPDEVLADAEAVANAFNDMMAELRKSDFDPDRIDTAVFESTTNDAAATRVEDYFSTNCDSAG